MLSGRRILLVDDDEHIREVAQLGLELVGRCEVLAAGSGREALEVARAEAPDAILLDVMMPELDGPATVELLRRDAATHAIPIVLLTAKVQACERAALEALDVAGVIGKPFDPMRLPDQVASMLAWDR